MKERNFKENEMLISSDTDLLKIYSPISKTASLLYRSHVLAKVFFLAGMMSVFAAENWTTLLFYIVACCTFALAGGMTVARYPKIWLLMISMLAICVVLDLYFPEARKSELGRAGHFLLGGATVAITALSFRRLIGVRQIASYFRSKRSKTVRWLGSYLAGSFFDYQEAERLLKEYWVVASAKSNCGEGISQRIWRVYQTFQSAMLAIFSHRFERDFLLDAKGYHSDRYRSYGDSSIKPIDVTLIFLGFILLSLPILARM